MIKSTHPVLQLYREIPGSEQYAQIGKWGGAFEKKQVLTTKDSKDYDEGEYPHTLDTEEKLTHYFEMTRKWSKWQAQRRATSNHQPKRHTKPKGEFKNLNLWFRYGKRTYIEEDCMSNQFSYLKAKIDISDITASEELKNRLLILRGMEKDILHYVTAASEERPDEPTAYVYGEAMLWGSVYKDAERNFFDTHYRKHGNKLIRLGFGILKNNMRGKVLKDGWRLLKLRLSENHGKDVLELYARFGNVNEDKIIYPLNQNIETLPKLLDSHITRINDMIPLLE
jgi:hypothetical protein